MSTQPPPSSQPQKQRDPSRPPKDYPEALYFLLGDPGPRNPGLVGVAVERHDIRMLDRWQIGLLKQDLEAKGWVPVNFPTYVQVRKRLRAIEQKWKMAKARLDAGRPIGKYGLPERGDQPHGPNQEPA